MEEVTRHGDLSGVFVSLVFTIPIAGRHGANGETSPTLEGLAPTARVGAVGRALRIFP
jgi:hypothetical protein